MNNQAKADEKSLKELFIGKCWSYLNDNFHKFNETNQIKIALELCKKDVPQEFKGNVQVTQMPTIKKGGKEAEFNIGTGTAEDPQSPTETYSDN